MGARYLLIEFDDEQQASRLRAQIDNATKSGKAFRVVGLFAKATKYCQCDPLNKVTTKTNDARLKRGKKYGWWVCLECRRPDSRMAGLVNLIKPRDIINPPKWMSRNRTKGLPDFETMNYIPTLSVTPEGPAGVEFWNTRG